MKTTEQQPAGQEWEPDSSCSHPMPQLGCPDCGAWLPSKPATASDPHRIRKALSAAKQLCADERVIAGDRFEHIERVCSEALTEFDQFLRWLEQRRNAPDWTTIGMIEAKLNGFRDEKTN